MNNEVGFYDLCHFFERQRQATDLADGSKYFLYGGSRGPGKSYWLRWYSIRFLLHWAGRGFKKVRAGLFCENYPALKDRHITKIASEFPAWLGEIRDSQRDGLAFHISPRYGGGVLALRNLDDPDKYKSSEFALVAVDELTQNRNISVFHTLRGSMRWPGLRRAKFVSASNPDGPGQKWVRQLWIEKDMPPELIGHEADFCYLPALPDDNPHLSEDYWSTLNTLPDALRRAWRFGDWYVTFEGLVYAEWTNENLTEAAPDPDKPVELAFDDGYIDPRAVLFIQRTADRVLVFDELYQVKRLEEETCEAIIDKMGEWFGWHDREARIPNKLPEIAVGSPEAHAFHRHLRKINIPVRINAIPSVVEALKPVRALIKDGNGKRTLQVCGRCHNLISEITSGYRYPEGTKAGSNEKPVDENNHAVDALRDWAWVRART